MKAKFGGTCKCGAHFEKHSEIEYSRIERKVTECPSCKGKNKNEGPDLGKMFDMAYEDQCASMCGPGL